MSLHDVSRAIRGESLSFCFPGTMIYRLHERSPVTSQVKGYPFEVPIKEGKAPGVVLADQGRSLDWIERKATSLGLTSETLV